MLHVESGRIEEATVGTIIVFGPYPENIRLVRGFFKLQKGFATVSMRLRGSLTGTPEGSIPYMTGIGCGFCSTEARAPENRITPLQQLELHVVQVSPASVALNLDYEIEIEKLV